AVGRYAAVCSCLAGWYSNGADCSPVLSRGFLDPAEALVVYLAPEATRVCRSACHQRIGGFLELLDRLAEQPPKLDHVGHQLVGEAVRFHAEARRSLNELGDFRHRFGAKLARLP